MALTDDKCEYCGESICQGAEPQRFTAVAAAATRTPNVERVWKVEDAGFCSDACRKSYGPALLVTELIAQTERAMPMGGAYLYEVVATEVDGTERRFTYVHDAPEPLAVGDTFTLKHGALDLRSFYRVTRMVSDGAVEAEWFMGGGPRYPDAPSRV